MAAPAADPSVQFPHATVAALAKVQRLFNKCFSVNYNPMTVTPVDEEGNGFQVTRNCSLKHVPITETESASHVDNGEEPPTRLLFAHMLEAGYNANRGDGMPFSKEWMLNKLVPKLNEQGIPVRSQHMFDSAEFDTHNLSPDGLLPGSVLITTEDVELPEHGLKIPKGTPVVLVSKLPLDTVDEHTNCQEMVAPIKDDQIFMIDPYCANFSNGHLCCQVFTNNSCAYIPMPICNLRGPTVGEVTTGCFGIWRLGYITAWEPYSGMPNKNGKLSNRPCVCNYDPTKVVTSSAWWKNQNFANDAPFWRCYLAFCEAGKRHAFESKQVWLSLQQLPSIDVEDIGDMPVISYDVADFTCEKPPELRLQNRYLGLLSCWKSYSRCYFPKEIRHACEYLLGCRVPSWIDMLEEQLFLKLSHQLPKTLHSLVLGITNKLGAASPRQNRYIKVQPLYVWFNHDDGKWYLCCIPTADVHSFLLNGDLKIRVLDPSGEFDHSKTASLASNPELADFWDAKDNAIAQLLLDSHLSFLKGKAQGTNAELFRFLKFLRSSPCSHTVVPYDDRGLDIHHVLMEEEHVKPQSTIEEEIKYYKEQRELRAKQEKEARRRGQQLQKQNISAVTKQQNPETQSCSEIKLKTFSCFCVDDTKTVCTRTCNDESEYKTHLLECLHRWGYSGHMKDTFLKFPTLRKHIAGASNQDAYTAAVYYLAKNESPVANAAKDELYKAVHGAGGKPKKLKNIKLPGESSTNTTKSAAPNKDKKSKKGKNNQQPKPMQPLMIQGAEAEELQVPEVEEHKEAEPNPELSPTSAKQASFEKASMEAHEKLTSMPRDQKRQPINQTLAPTEIAQVTRPMWSSVADPTHLNSSAFPPLSATTQAERAPQKKKGKRVVRVKPNNNLSLRKQMRRAYLR